MGRMYNEVARRFSVGVGFWVCKRAFGQCTFCPDLRDPRPLTNGCCLPCLQVASAARGLIGLFRDVAPEMLAKKDRGRGADLEAKPRQYGQQNVSERVEGADLLQQVG